MRRTLVLERSTHLTASVQMKIKLRDASFGKLNQSHRINSFDYFISPYYLYLFKFRFKISSLILFLN